MCDTYAPFLDVRHQLGDSKRLRNIVVNGVGDDAVTLSDYPILQISGLLSQS